MSDGEVRRVPPARLGRIGNGHHVKLSRDPLEESPWDFSFEKEFDAADSDFPAVISWLQSLDRKFKVNNTLPDRFLSQPATEKLLCMLTESVVSLAVRSPMNREAYAAFSNLIDVRVSNREREAIIGINMRSAQRLVADSIGAHGKYAVLFSTGKEFIYGDGFFHNVEAVVNRPLDPKMLVPITPTMSVIVSRPMSFMAEPRLSTIVLTDEEVEQCNHAIQVYARDALFFRSDVPTLVEAFMSGERRTYARADNPVNTLVRSLPGIAR